MRSAVALVLAALMVFPALAAQRASVDFTPLACVRGGELPLLQVNVVGKGELRAYFRRVNTTDWCSVEGTNEGALSRVVLPRFEPGEEIEYFFVLLDGRRVVARSQRIYRSAVTLDCEAAWARHILRLSLMCNDEPTGIPTALAAGYNVESTWVDGDPPQQSPDTPGTSASRGAARR